MADSQPTQTQSEQNSGLLAWICTTVDQGAARRNLSAIGLGQRRPCCKEPQRRH
jgi:hypothetical protein